MSRPILHLGSLATASLNAHCRLLDDVPVLSVDDGERAVTFDAGTTPTPQDVTGARRLSVAAAEYGHRLAEHIPAGLHEPRRPDWICPDHTERTEWPCPRIRDELVDAFDADVIAVHLAMAPYFLDACVDLSAAQVGTVHRRFFGWIVDAVLGGGGR